MEYLDSLPSNVEEINISYRNLHILPDLSRFTCLQKLYCSQNQLTRLNNLPSTLQELNCSLNQLIRLDNLPPFLKILNCDGNQLTQLDNLPSSLLKLDCSYNQLTRLELLECFAFHRSLRDNILFRFAKQYIIGGQFTFYFTKIILFR